MTEPGTHPRRVALVTGGTRGIGASISNRLIGRGVTVASAYHRDAESASQWLRSQSADAAASVHRGDISEPECCRRIVDEVLAEHGRIDFLVNNAGVVEERRWREIEPQEWDRALAANLSGPYHLIRAALDPMTAEGFGRIVNIGSVSAAMGHSVQIDYSAAKAGLIGLTRSVARAVARRGITVNCVIPGAVATELTDDLRFTDPKAVSANIPIGRYALPDEIAYVVCSLLDADASYVTGAVIVVDGGLSMGT